MKHTWDSYRGARNGLLRAPDWEPALDRLAQAGVPVVLVEGGVDPVPVSGPAAALADATASERYLKRLKATHLLPLTEGRLVLVTDRRVPRLDVAPQLSLGRGSGDLVGDYASASRKCRGIRAASFALR